MDVTFVNETNEALLVETQLAKTGAFSSFLLPPTELNRVGDRGERMHWRWVRGNVSPNDNRWQCYANPETTVIIDNSQESIRCLWSPQR